MNRRNLGCLTIALVAMGTGRASAGFGSWSAEVESDPFTKSSKVVVTYMETIRSAVVIFCDGKDHSIRIRAVPGYVWSDALEGGRPTMQFAIDGDLVYTGEGTTGIVGDNLASAEVTLERASSDQFVSAFSAAKKQIAVKDGMSDGPQLLSARGSTKAGDALAKCLAESP